MASKNGCSCRPKDREARVLIADDSAISRLVAVAQTQRLGYAPASVTNGAELISALGEVHYELLLVDCQMPTLDGFEATSLIRNATNLGPMSGVPIIGMTGGMSEQDRQKCIECGMNDCIAKPLHEKELAKILEVWTRCRFPKSCTKSEEKEASRKLLDEGLII